MKSKLIFVIAISLVAYSYEVPGGSAVARTVGAAGYVQDTQNTQNANLFSPDELDNLLASIALFPDPLLAQMIPAATFVDQITEAANWVRRGNKPADIDNQPWDVSVKGIAHYPHSLFMLSDYPDWTTAIGQAYVAQPADVLASIQRLRVQAKEAGTLQSTPQQTVAQNQGSITIEPAEPAVIYEPIYDPLYAYAPPSTIIPGGWLSFGAGLIIGAWLNRDVIWPSGGFRYHGWNGGGWIGAARPHVDLRNSAYVNNRFNNIAVNRDVLNRNINAANLNRYNSVHRNTNWGNVDRANMTRHARPAPGNLPGRPGAPGTPGARPGTLPKSPAAGTRPLPKGPPAATRPAQRPAAPRHHAGTHRGSSMHARPHHGGGFHRGGGFRGGGGRGGRR
jgi:uncharacterized membrane protein YgcG